MVRVVLLDVVFDVLKVVVVDFVVLKVVVVEFDVL